MAAQIKTPSNFNAARDIVFSQMMKNTRGGRSQFVNDTSGGRIRLQTPLLRCPFGLSRYDANDGNSSFSIDVSLDGQNSFHEQMIGVEAVMRKNAVDTSPEWLGKSINEDTLDILFKSYIKPPSNEKYAPTMKLKITPYTQFFDKEGNVAKKEDIVKGTKVKAIIEFSPWFISGSTGCTLKIIQLMIVETPVAGLDKLNDFAFIEDDSADNAENAENAGSGQTFLD